jgi:hypothetical protein
MPANRAVGYEVGLGPCVSTGKGLAALPILTESRPYLITGCSTGAGSGGGAFPFPLPIQSFAQPLRLATASVATIAIKILLIKQSFPRGRNSL